MMDMTPCSASALSLDQACHILSSLPPVQFAFAYGSAIIPQRQVGSGRRMIDIVVAVDDALQWHQENLSRNPTHYSLLMTLLGHSAISRLQRSSFGARVYFNTIIPPSSVPSFKYGVVEMQHLRKDLLTWDSLYLSGRLHKPVRILTHSVPPPSLADALATNLNAAAAAALLTLPPRFSEHDLYTAITRLSYLGDVRMHLPLEPSSKVRDIVSPNLDRFRALYAHTLAIRNTVSKSPHGLWSRAVDPTTQARLLRVLPLSIRSRVADSIAVSTHASRRKELPYDLTIVGNAVTAALAATVARSSFAQSTKGLVTAGISNSLRYLGAKLQKALRASFSATLNRSNQK